MEFRYNLARWFYKDWKYIKIKRDRVATKWSKCVVGNEGGGVGDGMVKGWRYFLAGGRRIRPHNDPFVHVAIIDDRRGESSCLLSHPLLVSIFSNPFSPNHFRLFFTPLFLPLILRNSLSPIFCTIILTPLGAILTLSSHRPSSCTWTWILCVHRTYTNTNK